MNKIVPFKKEIEFETNIAEISSISLEHTLKLKEENLVSGEFIVSGTFKMTEASVNTDSFEYRLPFDISIDTKYDTKNIDVDINDFYYEVINSKILEVNIEVILDGLEEKEERTLIEENIETLNENSEDAEEVKEKEKLILDLENSNSFARTHFIISKLKAFNNWSDKERQQLKQIAEKNNQVSYIKDDEDIASFYSSLG